MSTALILPRSADEQTIDEACANAKVRGLVPCVPKRFAVGQPFRIVFIRPDSIPSTWRQMVIGDRQNSAGGTPCAA